jgi:hypothetical protein
MTPTNIRSPLESNPFAMFSRAFVIAPLLVSGVAAWGNLGHETVGYVAQAVRGLALQTVHTG